MEQNRKYECSDIATFIIDAVPKRHIDGVVLATASTNLIHVT